jgi:hypothetical protein
MPWSAARLRALLALVVADLLLLAAVSATCAEATVSAPHGARIIAEEKPVSAWSISRWTRPRWAVPRRYGC